LLLFCVPAIACAACVSNGTASLVKRFLVPAFQLGALLTMFGRRPLCHVCFCKGRTRWQLAAGGGATTRASARAVRVGSWLPAVVLAPAANTNKTTSRIILPLRCAPLSTGRRLSIAVRASQLGSHLLSVAHRFDPCWFLSVKVCVSYPWSHSPPVPGPFARQSPLVHRSSSIAPRYRAHHYSLSSVAPRQSPLVPRPSWSRRATPSRWSPCRATSTGAPR